MAKLNRIRIVLAEHDLNNKWLADKLGKDQATISKWVTNTTQPSLEAYRVERTTSTGDMDKFQEAICDFANDLSGSRKKGYLIPRAYDDGGNVGGNVGGDNVPSLSPALSPVLSQVVTSLSQVGRRAS